MVNLIWTQLASFEEKRIKTTRKTQHVYLGEKEGERISAMRNTMIHGTENLGLEPMYEFKSGNESTMDQVLVVCNRAYDIATLKHEEGVSHNQKVQCKQASLYSDSTLHCKRKCGLESSCLCQLYFEWIQRTRQILGDFILLIIVKFSNALWCFLCLLVESFFFWFKTVFPQRRVDLELLMKDKFLQNFQYNWKWLSL